VVQRARYQAATVGARHAGIELAHYLYDPDGQSN